MGRVSVPTMMKNRDNITTFLWLLALVFLALSFFVALCFTGKIEKNYKLNSELINSLVSGLEGEGSKGLRSIEPHNEIRMAGSGTNIPLTVILAEEFKKTHSGTPVAIYESIGSKGAVRAVMDGVVDIGLLSRPLKPEESNEIFETYEYARTICVFGANFSVEQDSITSKELVEIYEGKKRKWSDGTQVVVLQREEWDSTNSVFFKAFPLFKIANEEAYRKNRWKVIFTDGQMLEALETTPGAIGPTDAGAIIARKLKIKILKLNGIYPDVQNVQQGFYPHTKPLIFLIRKDSSSATKDFVKFGFSSIARKIIIENGYILPDFTFGG